MITIIITIIIIIVFIYLFTKIFKRRDNMTGSEVHKKLIKLLKPGGILLLEGFNKAQLNNTTGGPKNEEMLFDKNMLKDDFKDLEIILLKDDVINLDEGKVHKGRADVINFIGAADE